MRSGGVERDRDICRGIRLAFAIGSRACAIRAPLLWRSMRWNEP